MSFINSKGTQLSLAMEVVSINQLNEQILATSNWPKTFSKTGICYPMRKSRIGYVLANVVQMVKIKRQSFK